MIGLPDHWQDYCRVIENFPNRVTVGAIFHRQPKVAREIADSVDATAVGGVLRMISRQDVSCLILQDAGWLGSQLMTAIAESKKPVFLTSQTVGLADLQALESVVALNRSIWVPRLQHRFTPATTRLMELIATQIGSPNRIDVLMENEDDAWSRQAVAEVIDWSFFVLQKAEKIRSVRIEQGGCRIRVEMKTDSVLDIFVRTVRANEKPSWTVRCSRGEAMVLQDSKVEWKLTGHESNAEVLNSEHSGLAMQLLVFLRRAAGGLIPTADIGDLHRSYAAADQILQARF